MKIDEKNIQGMNLELLDSIQDRIRELKQNATMEWLKDETIIRFRGEIDHSIADISPEDTIQRLDQIIQTGRGARLGDVHANLNMDRIRQLLTPL